MMLADALNVFQVSRGQMFIELEQMPSRGCRKKLLDVWNPEFLAVNFDGFQSPGRQFGLA